MCGAPLQAAPNSPLVVILGPTASGKTTLSLEMAGAIGAEILSADSRQVYRGLDIGTAKVTVAERHAIPHHLLDLVDPDESFGLADFQLAFHDAELSIRSRGSVPLLVGGSAQYIWSILEGWSVPRVPPNASFRETQMRRAVSEGPSALYAELEQLDPEAARVIHPNNVRRVVRALEILAFTGKQASALRTKDASPRPAIVLGLSLPRAELHARADLRIDTMFQTGFVEEVEGLLMAGYGPELPSMSGIGYTQVVQFLRGALSFPEAVARAKSATHRYVRQQATWFRADDDRIRWVSPGDVGLALEHVRHRIDHVMAAPAKGDGA